MKSSALDRSVGLIFSAYAKGLLTGAFFLCATAAVNAEAPVGPAPHPAAIASAHPLATEAGMAVLAAGGNAFDAAVAVSAVLAVVEPYSSGIGGGGFWLLHEAASQRDVMIDGRETAPLSAHSDLYLDDDGEVIPGASMNGPLSAGIPGEPAALVHIAQNYGRLPLSRSLAPAVRLAREGFPADEIYLKMAGFRLESLRASAESSKIFLNAGQLPEQGSMITQPDLALTLEMLAAKGHKGFYAGEVAEKLVEGVRAAGGIWSPDDLAAYQVRERPVIKVRYGDIKVTTAALPSSGGIVLAEMLNQLEQFDLTQLSEVQQVHLIVEAMRRAYRDRAEFLGDVDFVEVPVKTLISKSYAAGLTRSIRMDRATASDLLRPTASDPPGGNHTTHFSIVDNEGNRVAATLSINYPFGSGFVVPGTGVLLNDEMDDFVAKPGVPNAYGLVGAQANAIEPGKRMLSSMTPTFLEDDQRIGIIGSPGGSRIITMVLLGTLGFSANATAEEIVNMPRIHHQYLPDLIQVEPGAISPSTSLALEAMGHQIKQLNSTYGNMQMVTIDKATGNVEAASDPRGIGAARVGAIMLATPVDSRINK
ncbi:MAG: gamma-glutamyltransferase [Thiotrichales bacterium]